MGYAPAFASTTGLDAYDAAMVQLRERHTEAGFLVDIPAGESGEWSVDHFTVERNVAAMRLWRDGRPCPPGRYTRLGCKSEGLFMTDTPAEANDLRGFLRCASGVVLIGGLGLGMMLRPLLRKSEVESVVVLEKSPDVIKLVAPSYADLRPRLEIINADVFTWKPDRMFSWAWWDIWPTICEDNRPEFGRLRRRYSRSMVAPGRQLVWAEDTLNRERDADRRRYY